MTLRKVHELISAGDIQTAKDILDTLVSEDPFDHLSVRAYWHMRQHQYDPAIALLDKARALRPLDMTVHFNLGLCLYSMNRYPEATEAFRKVVLINPGYALGWMKLGGMYLHTGKFAEGLACQERAYAMEPDDAQINMALATTLSLFEADEEAIRHYRKALAINPDAFEADVGLGHILLRSGEWDEGWKRFEARWKLHPHGAPWDWKKVRPWTGKPDDLNGRNVLVYAEQGYGDTIHFCRYLPLVAERAAKMVVACPPRLVKLLSTLGYEVRDDYGSRDDPDWPIKTSMMSLPLIFGTPVHAAPPPARFNVQPHVVADVKVGVCWHGASRPDDGPAHQDDQRRSIPWEQFSPIASVVPCMSLQQEDLGTTDWIDTAAIVAGLDLVITVDTAVAHLAASLGVETWCLLRKGGCWRWLTTGDRTCWYPSMRLYRQPVLHEWGPVIDRVVTDLKQRVGSR